MAFQSLNSSDNFPDTGGYGSTALGYDADATGNYSTAIGFRGRADGVGSVDIGLGDSTHVCDQDYTMCVMGGDVGIGTTNPQSTLHVDGAVDNNGTTAVLQITDTAASEHMLLDANEIDALNSKLFINYNSNNDVVFFGKDQTTAQVDVHGAVRAEEVIVEMFTPDYVFGSNYDLMTLDEVEKYIDENSHLPGVPSAQDVDEHGVSLGDHQAVLLQKIEELTLHVIEQNKRIRELEKVVVAK